MNDRLWGYLRRDKRMVRGWLQRTDAEIFGTILDLQMKRGIRGSAVEIGVHEGKSFIPMCMALRSDESAMCIDLFENQSLNLDASGKGNLENFQRNLGRFGIRSEVKMFKGSSGDVTADYILQHVGPVRFFSVDGGHWKSIVINDLALAERTLTEGGVIALDDYCRAEWPDVTHGYALWQEQCQDIVPFAAGSNKLYLCHRSHAAVYREALRTPFLNAYFAKQYRSESMDYDVYRLEPVEQDEQPLKSVLRYVIKMFYPGLLIAMRRI